MPTFPPIRGLTETAPPSVQLGDALSRSNATQASFNEARQLLRDALKNEENDAVRKRLRRVLSAFRQRPSSDDAE